MRVYRRDLRLADKLTYLSNPAMGVVARDRRWGVIADDKLLTYAILLGHGISTPKVHAIAHPTRRFHQCITLRSASEFEQYVLTQVPYPFFSKPVSGSFSKDGMLVESLDRARGALRLGDGSTIPLRDYVQRSLTRKSGIILQELLHPHPEIAGLVGNRLCTVRMMVLFDDDGARLYCAMWKIAAPGNMADNYWREGNILALLDHETGAVRRCTTGLGSKMQEIQNHPATGVRLVGFVLPQWQELVDLTLRAAHTMPGLPIQAWDMAPTSKGPMALEVNVFGSLFLPQVATQCGLYQGALRDFMEAHRV